MARFYFYELRSKFLQVWKLFGYEEPVHETGRIVQEIPF